jgi:hypothetical protein
LIDRILRLWLSLNPNFLTCLGIATAVQW